jgi:hypothetical protein
MASGGTFKMTMKSILGGLTGKRNMTRKTTPSSESAVPAWTGLENELMTRRVFYIRLTITKLYM